MHRSGLLADVVAVVLWDWLRSQDGVIEAVWEVVAYRILARL